MKIFWCLFDTFNECLPRKSDSLESTPFREPKIKWAPRALTRVNAVCTEIYIWLHKSATSLYDWYVATWRYDCNLLYEIFVLTLLTGKKPNKWTRSSLWEYLTAFSSIRILNTRLTFIHNTLMFFSSQYLHSGCASIIHFWLAFEALHLIHLVQFRIIRHN